LCKVAGLTEKHVNVISSANTKIEDFDVCSNVVNIHYKKVMGRALNQNCR